MSFQRSLNLKTELIGNMFCKQVYLLAATTTIILESSSVKSSKSFSIFSQNHKTYNDKTHWDDGIIGLWQIDWEALEREECYGSCKLEARNKLNTHKSLKKHIIKEGLNLVVLKVNMLNYTLNVLETSPYMGAVHQASLWTLSIEPLGSKLLKLPIDADVLSLNLIHTQKPVIDLPTISHPHHCLVRLSPKCRLSIVRNHINSLIKEIENEDMLLQISSLKMLCNYVLHHAKNVSRFAYKCCKIENSQNLHPKCQIIYTDSNQEINFLQSIINIISFIITLYSPLIVLKIKKLICFDGTTKFFKASLKHGITGQRNYVIRISYRQMINLCDPKPFSLPRAFFRLICHCYGEGRCCIHCWNSWPYQPCIFSASSRFKKLWFLLLKILGVLLIYPLAIHIAVILYYPNLKFYHQIIKHSHDQNYMNTVKLNLQTIGHYMSSNRNIFLSLWVFFSSLSFVYVSALLSWSQYPLEKCLAHQKNKKVENGINVLQNKFSKSYKAILFEMSYGQDSNDYRYFLKLPLYPFQLKRILRCTFRTIKAYIPLINVCSFLFKPTSKAQEQTQNSTLTNNHNSFNNNAKQDHSRLNYCTNKFVNFFVWIGFILLLLGYCSIVFIISDFCINVLFFIFIANLIYPINLFPLFFCVFSFIFYINETLKNINFDQKYILKLIDQHSPRLSTMERNDFEEESTTASKTLKIHNLGAVKFVDGDGSEYVSKELYYKVSADLKYSFSCSVRKFLKEFAQYIIYFLLLFIVVKISICFSDSLLCATALLIIGGLLPKVNTYRNSADNLIKNVTRKQKWEKIISEVLDRHIRVDLMAGAVVEEEEHLTTYGVRPVGTLEMDLPRKVIFRSLHVWKFPWNVSIEQQSSTNEMFIHILSSRIACISFVSRILVKSLPEDLTSERVMKNWSLLIENCILEANSKTTNLQGTSFMDTCSLFSLELQSLVSLFDAGSSIDTLVDSINCELYGFCVIAVIASINNTTFVILKLRCNKLLLFNASCHGDHMSDFFGALLIMADFNAQNLQLMIKYLLEPSRPDSVPVYEEISSEAVAIRSSEIFNIESSI